ncbi:multidrug efflux SMR transporter [Halobacillus salinarum]|uniref:Multidrug efflux SMR transporter n=1 Tax=Halobacillus salinarum TaxID=2932257 RepID=A0ABY4EH74_9BACI|nr:multidrug efflux SMR transporter [Halobacillus salinarum]UOQ43800.1 multidrug efflux SMR transporter [Halobacillus salinarum]
MAWVFLIAAGVSEMIAMYFLKLSEGFRFIKTTILSICSFGISFYLLSLALKEISIGTSYSIWTGIGAIGTVLVGIVIFKENANRKKLIFIGCILVGVVGLKLVS